tara:strand:- start:77 stop:385 length:309 start_codon:yes stop_codon:yes gene_type:complete
MARSAAQDHTVKVARAVGEAVDGGVEGLEYGDVQVVEWHFAFIEQVKLAVAPAEVFAAADEEQVVAVVVRGAVAAAVVDEGVVEQVAVGLGGWRRVSRRTQS